MRYLIRVLVLFFLLLAEVGLKGIDGQRQRGDLINKNEIDKIITNADLYLQMNDVPKAISLLLDNLNLCEDSAAQAYMKYKIGSAYLIEGRHEEAWPFLISYKSYQESKRDSIGLAKASIILGKYYCQCKDYSNAINLLFKALNLIPHCPEVEAMAFLELAEVNVQTGVFSEAKKYAQKALTISIALNHNDLKLKCFTVLSNLYEVMGDYQSALYYNNKRIFLQNEILRSNASALLRLQSFNDDEKSIVENDTLLHLSPKRVVVDLTELKNNDFIYWGSILFLFVLGLVFFMLFRSKMLLSRKLKRKNEELEKLNATKDKFFSIIAHDLKSPFNSLMGFSELLSLQVENRSQQEIVAYSQSIYNSTRKLYSLVETLLQWSRTQLGTTEYKPERLDVKIVIGNIVSILKINAEEKDIVISVDVADNLLAWADKDLLGAVLRNLISNAIKFSRVGSVISVSAREKGTEIEISVKDAGVGISKNNLEKIFKVDANISTAGTFNEKGTGLGLVLCKEFVEINKGVITAESKLEKGSTFKFTVPLCTKNCF